MRGAGNIKVCKWSNNYLSSLSLGVYTKPTFFKFNLNNNISSTIYNQVIDLMFGYKLNGNFFKIGILSDNLQFDYKSFLYKYYSSCTYYLNLTKTTYRNFFSFGVFIDADIRVFCTSAYGYHSNVICKMK